MEIKFSLLLQGLALEVTQAQAKAVLAALRGEKTNLLAAVFSANKNDEGAAILAASANEDFILVATCD